MYIPRRKACVALCTLAVELYALEADVFLQQRFGQERHGFAYKPVETLPGVVVFDCQLFHAVQKPLYSSDFLNYTI